ncbi:hypothetical protein FQR65_LT16494 [Abscondita terminalis]|nr:hypothetical protein FQR65_LT16494 [Abscondita terminalis]
MIKDPSHRRDLAVAVIFSVKNRNNYCGAFSFFDIHTNAYKYLVSVAINSVTSLQFPKMSSDEEEILLLLALAEDEIELSYLSLSASPTLEECFANKIPKSVWPQVDAR